MNNAINFQQNSMKKMVILIGLPFLYFLVFFLLPALLFEHFLYAQGCSVSELGAIFLVHRSCFLCSLEGVNVLFLVLAGHYFSDFS